jgi:hypothetical protein
MQFSHGQTVFRDRRRVTPNPYNPASNTPGSWEGELDTITIENAWVAASSSTGTASATRVQVITQKSLFCQPGEDVAPGDRIRADGVAYDVPAKGSADVNPFTGWQPVAEFPLEEVDG